MMQNRFDNKFFFGYKSLIFQILACLLLFSCKSDKPDISAIKLELEIRRLDKDIFKYSGRELSEKYGKFFDYYTVNILRLGKYDTPEFERFFEILQNNVQTVDSTDYYYINFKNDLKLADSAVNQQFPDIDKLTKKLTEAFKYYRYYFPEKYIPEINTYISGFYHSVILTDSVIGIGLDKYLGSDYGFLYDNLGFSRYLSLNMHREKILSDCISAWISGEWSFDFRTDNNLISRMIYEGKILYATKKILPDDADTLIFGFSGDQLKWCKNNEANMWIHLIDNKLLFATEPLTIRKLTEFAPYTTEFTSESPGRACNWVGYRIVSKYMTNNPDKTLAQMLDNEDYNEIYKQAKYKP